MSSRRVTIRVNRDEKAKVMADLRQMLEFLETRDHDTYWIWLEPGQFKIWTEVVMTSEAGSYQAWIPLSEAIAFLEAEGLPSQFVQRVLRRTDGQLLLCFFAPGDWDEQIRQAGYEVTAAGANTRTVRKRGDA